MDDKKLDELLHDMKNDYENLPESVDTKTVKQRVFRKRQWNWNKFIPTLAAIAGLIIFVIITVGTIDSKQQANEDSESDSPLMEYFSERKEAFQESLGLEDVDNLERVQQARELVDYYEENGEIGDGKHNIYKLLETPKMKIKDFNETVSSSGIPDYFAAQTVISKMKDFQMTFQFLLEDRINANKSKSEKRSINKYQDNPKANNLSTAVEELLTAFNKHGYFITMTDSGKLTAKVDYLYIVESLDLEQSTITAYADYLKLLGTKIDPENPGIGNSYGIDWTEFDDVLLSIEELYNNYKDMDEQYLMFNDQLSNYTRIYLYDYLSAKVGVGELIPEEAQKELNAFLKEHKKSKFWNLVNEAVEQYKNNDWVRTDFEVSRDLVRKMMESDKEYDWQNYDEKIEIALLPLDDSLMKTYEKYKESFDSEILKDLSAFEVMQLYMHASDKGDFDVYYSLYDKNGVLADVSKEELQKESAMTANTEFQQLAEKTNYILVEEQPEEKRKIFYFVTSADTGTEAHAFRVVQNDDGVWNVPFMPMQ
ncbi:hypothetical protein [Virgibacillus doumboii]|uniref:hypothetical protein n=1 Tax=Virgibacillus doumboii TaxID=2697503 RepID=UPI0013E0097D|nr:hypothetical protein [Virgibacillus doumboii]